jgi:hypothetical protein
VLVNILENLNKEIEKYFIKIDIDLLEKVKKDLANCEDFEVAELKAKQKLLEHYLFSC